MINSRKLVDLDSVALDICLRQIASCRKHGIEIIVTSTWRDIEAQNALYAIGRTVDKDKRPVTNAEGGHSWHNYKVAWDVVPIIQGKPVWDSNDPVWQEVIKAGEDSGAEAGAKWKTFPDLPHFQIRPIVKGLPIEFAAALDRFQLHGTIFHA